MIMATNHFVSGNPIMYDRSKFPKFNVNEYDLQSKSLSEIRKGLSTMSKKSTKKKSHKKPADNIVERAIGNTENLMSELDSLKQEEPQDSKGFDDLEPFTPLPEFGDDPLDDDLIGDISSEPLTGLDEFETTDVFSGIEKEEDGTIDLVAFFRKVQTYGQMIACTNLLLKYDFYFSKEENNGDAMLSEIFSAIDRISGDKAGLIDFACKHYDIYDKSLKDMVVFAVDSYSGEIKEVLEAFVKCMK